MPREIEAKFPLLERATLVERLEAIGAERLYPETFEDNILFDRRGELRTRGAVLRVRQFGRYTIVTWKGPASYADGVKSRREVETGIESFERAVDLLDALGFRPVFRYQKLREVWRFAGSEIVLDRTPIGDFLEIEGERDQIEEIAGTLDLSMSDSIQMTYADLYRQQRRIRPDLSENMIFKPEEIPSR